jgi:hypothetical protein
MLRMLPRVIFMSLKAVREKFFQERRRLLVLSTLKRKPTKFLLVRETMGAEVWRRWPPKPHPSRTKLSRPPQDRG